MFGFQCVARNIEALLKDLYFIFGLSPDLAKYSYR
jgi:hypothetical protein